MKIQRLRYWCIKLQDYGNGRTVAVDLEPRDGAEEYNLIGSLCNDGRHRPVLDIDIPVRLVPSSTQGHGHLYLDTDPMSWDDYQELLGALAKAGIISDDYKAHSVRNGMTLVRPPHHRKTKCDNKPAERDDTLVEVTS